MRIPRIFIHGELREGLCIFVEDRGVVHKLRDVLRFKEGGYVRVFNNSGSEFFAGIESLERGRVKLRIEKILSSSQSAYKISLWLPLIKDSRLEVAVEKSVELGAYSIHYFIHIGALKEIFQTVS